LLLLLYQSWPNLHSTENMMPCMPLARILVPRPRTMRPITPSFSTTMRTTWGYVMASVAVCLVVLMTRMLLEEQSEMKEEQKPIRADLDQGGG
jgi:hypothetical protein